MAKPIVVEKGWFDTLKNSVQFDSLSQKLNLTRYKLIDIVFFIGIGFLLGFLWKRFANYCMVFIALLAVIVVLQQLDLLTVYINWTKVQECCGIEPLRHHDVDTLTIIWEWIKSNIVIIFSFVVGFSLGNKMS